MVRSRNAPLSLDINLGGYTRWRKVLEQLVPFKDRWKYLDARFAYDMPNVLRAFPSLELPYLETLSARFVTAEHSDKFLTEWRFPRLTSLTLVDVVPPCGLFRNLTTFELISDRMGSGAFLGKLMSFLSQTPSLRKLHLDMACFAGPFLSHLFVVELPNLSTISVFHRIPGLLYGNEPLPAIILRSILQALKIPNVSEFRLHPHFRSRQGVADWISSFVMIPEVLRPVTSLEVRMEFPIDDDTLTRFFTPFPNIQELELDVPDLASTIQRGSWELKLDHLRSLHVDDEIVDLCRKQPEMLNHFSSNPAQIHVTGLY